jgi:hypothetical protein
MFHLLCLANKFKYKTKTKTRTKERNTVVTLSYVPPPEKERQKNYFAYFQNQGPATCNYSLFFLTAPYMTLFTALIRMPCNDVEC